MITNYLNNHPQLLYIANGVFSLLGLEGWVEVFKKSGSVAIVCISFAGAYYTFLLQRRRWKQAQQQDVEAVQRRRAEGGGVSYQTEYNESGG